MTPISLCAAMTETSNVFSVSAGAACSSGKVGPSHVLGAMGLGPDLVGSVIRVSLGWASSEADVSHFLRAWTALYRRCCRSSRRKRAA